MLSADADAARRRAGNRARIQLRIHGAGADGRQNGLDDIASSINTTEMAAFLRHVGSRHSGQFVVMVLDGAPSYRSMQLAIPENMALVRLPPYSPELNTVEHLWDEIREKHFANLVFDMMGGVKIAQAVDAMDEWESSPDAVRSLSAWPWIVESLQSS